MDMEYLRRVSTNIVETIIDDLEYNLESENPKEVRLYFKELWIDRMISILYDKIPDLF